MDAKEFITPSNEQGAHHDVAPDKILAERRGADQEAPDTVRVGRLSVEDKEPSEAELLRQASGQAPNATEAERHQAVEQASTAEDPKAALDEMLQVLGGNKKLPETGMRSYMEDFLKRTNNLE